MTWNPPLRDIICLLMCFCKILDIHSLLTMLHIRKKENKRDEPYPNFLVKNLQDLFTCAPFEQLTVCFETLYGFLTPACGTELQHPIFRGVVFPWFG